MRVSIGEDQDKYHTDNQNLGESSWKLPRPKGPMVRSPKTVKRAAYLLVRSAVKLFGISEKYITRYMNGARLMIPDDLAFVVDGGLGSRSSRLVVRPHYDRRCSRITRGADGRFVYFKDGDPNPYPLERGFSPCQGCVVFL